MSLQQFLVDNRAELIKRTRAKVATRTFPQPSEAEMEHGVPIFLSQLVKALGDEEEARASAEKDPAKKDPAQKDPVQKAGPLPPQNANITRGAALHGQDLRKFGFTIEQVVHDYGDVCQAVTELADEGDTAFTTTEFHTLNKCLDNAIAGAVTSWTEERDKSRAKGGREDLIRLELLNLVGTATLSFEALRGGRVGSSGATAAILGKCLAEMRSLLDDARQVAE